MPYITLLSYPINAPKLILGEAHTRLGCLPPCLAGLEINLVLKYLPVQCGPNWPGSVPLPSPNHDQLLLAMVVLCRLYVHNVPLWGSPAPVLGLSVLPRLLYFRAPLPKSCTQHPEYCSGLPPARVFRHLTHSPKQTR